MIIYIFIASLDGYTTHHLKIDFLHRNFDDLRIAVYKTPLVNISNDNLYILYKSVIDSLGCFKEVPI